MAVYHLGKWWNDCLEPTNVSAVWNCPEFKSLDDFVVKFRKEIISETREMSSIAENMLDFDLQHRDLMLKSPNPNSWKIAWLKYFGRPISRKLSSHLQQIVDHPIVYNCSISVLEPGGGIPLHVGQCQALLKYHIPITIPEGDVGMSYNGKTYRWDDRMLFNDTLQHAVWNRTSEKRVIILMDIIRPMPFPWNVVNQRVLDLAWLDPVIRERFSRL
jgi:aspartyl/asparaginyl beta-hydroxylase (cupin superfamily)